MSWIRIRPSGRPRLLPVLARILSEGGYFPPTISLTLPLMDSAQMS